MTFLSPFVLFALATAAIPVILHLVNLQKPQRIQFSSLTFVRSLQQKSAQKLKIRRWLLLALRVATVSCIVIAFAGPMIAASWMGSSGEREAATVGIVLDTAPSMGYGADGQTRMDRAREQLQELSDQLTRRDQLITATTTDPTPRVHESVASAMERLSGEQPAAGAQQLSRAASRMAAFLDRDGRHASRAVAIISDMQRTTLTDSVETAWPDAVQSILMPVTADAEPYPTIQQLEIQSPFATVGGEVDIQATISAYREDDEPVVANLFLNDQRVAQRTLSTSPGTQRLQFQVTPTESGWLPLRLELDHAGPAIGTQRHAVMHVPERQRIAVIHGTNSSTRYVQAVLELQLNEGQPLFDVDVHTEQNPPPLDDYDVVMAVGLQQGQPALIQELASFAETGGGVHIFPGAPTGDLAMATFLSETAGPEVTGRREFSDEQVQVNFHHPILRDIYEPGTSPDDVEQPAIHQLLTLQPASNQQPILQGSGGDPILLEHAYGEGTILTWALAPDTEWSQMPESALFVPLMHRAVQYTAGHVGAAGATLLSGRSGRIPVAARSSSYDLIGPDGTAHALQYRSAGQQAASRQLFVRTAPRTPGIYDLSRVGAVVQRVAVNMPPEEVDPFVYTAEESRQILAGWLQTEPALSHETPALAELLVESGARTHVWSIFVLLAVLFFIAESVVARVRYGKSASARRTPQGAAT